MGCLHGVNALGAARASFRPVIPLVILLAGLAATGAAQAGRPFDTEDAGVLDAGACEWESVAGRASARGAPRQTAWSTQLGCGLGPGLGLRSQLALGLGRASAASQRTDAWSLGGKTLLRTAVTTARRWPLPLAPKPPKARATGRTAWAALR